MTMLRSFETGSPRRSSQPSTPQCDSGASRPSISPIPYARKRSRLSAVTWESNWRRLPTATFRGLANSFDPSAFCLELRFWKSTLYITTSPRTSSTRGIPVPCRRKGIVRTVLMFGVTFSPVVPSPRVAAWTKTPSSYLRLTARPSNLSSHEYSTPTAFRPSRTFRSKLKTSSSLKALLSERIGTLCTTSSNSGLGGEPTL